MHILELDIYRRGLSPGATATKPKYVMEIDERVAYFKFDLSVGEIHSELLAYEVGLALDVPVAETCAAMYKGNLGIVSFDIGAYSEVDDSLSYSVRDFIGIPGFITMCLFDYLIMNEDRHARNWGVVNGAVAPLFDHNISFGADVAIRDEIYFMSHVTSAFTVYGDYDNNMDIILKYFCTHFSDYVQQFMRKVDDIKGRFYTENDKIDLLNQRIVYMSRKVGEYLEAFDN